MHSGKWFEVVEEDNLDPEVDEEKYFFTYKAINSNDEIHKII